MMTLLLSLQQMLCMLQLTWLDSPRAAYVYCVQLQLPLTACWNLLLLLDVRD